MILRYWGLCIKRANRNWIKSQLSEHPQNVLDEIKYAPAFIVTFYLYLLTDTTSNKLDKHLKLALKVKHEYKHLVGVYLHIIVYYYNNNSAKWYHSLTVNTVNLRSDDLS